MPNEIKNQEVKVQDVKPTTEVKNAVAVMEKDIADIIFNRVNEMTGNNQLIFPTNYAVGNALKSAYLIIQKTQDKNYKPALEVCTKISVANALLDMVLQGLSPVKKQCYFIVRGNELQLFVSYFGHQVAAKNIVPTISDIYATCIYEGDEVEEEVVNGQRTIKSHKTKFGNEDKPIVGAYSVIVNNGKIDYEIMTKAEIDMAWSHSSSKEKTVHKEFPQEMSKRTVLNRHCKRYINISDDRAMLYAAEAYERTISKEYDFDTPESSDQLQIEVDTKANQKPLIIEEPTKEVTPTDGPDF